MALPGSNAVATLTGATGPAPGVSYTAEGPAPYGVAAVPALNGVIATNSGDGTASVLSAGLGQGGGPLEATIAVGRLPDAVAVATTAAGTFAYVANEASNSLSVMKLAG